MSSVYITLLALGLGIFLILNRKSEKFVFGSTILQPRDGIDPEKWYFLGKRVQSRTITEPTGNGQPCSEFPDTIYKEAQPIDAKCRENSETNYTFGKPLWGMAISRKFIRNSKPLPDTPFLLRHIQSGLYLLPVNGLSGSNIVFGSLTETELQNPSTNLKGQWTIKTTSLNAGKFGQVTRQQLLPLVNTNLVTQPEACVSGNNIALKILPSKDNACDGAYSNGVANMYTGWWFQLVSGGIYLGHWQSNFRVHPYGGSAAQGVQAVLFNAEGSQALFEWRYV
jgi:hypothetical protein